MLKQFYEKTLPSQGFYCVTSIKDGAVRNRFAESLDELVDLVETLNETEHNVFVALSSFGNYSRAAKNAIYARSFYIDLDVDPENPRKYASKDAALEDLDGFLKIAKLPPPVRVDSGNGVHAYWLFDEDIPIPEWKRYVDKFKSLCNDYIKIDNNVTGDAARILRCPETNNYKTDPPRPTKFIDTDFGQYSFQQFKEFLGVEQTVEEILAGIQPDLPPKEDNFDYVFETIAVKSLTDKGCPQIKNVIVNQATLEEPLWRAGLSVAIRCADGKDAIHKISSKHPGYSPENTEAKANETLTATWAYGCHQFEKLNPGGCDGCAFRGRFTKSGPIQLGRRLKEAPSAEEASEENTVRVAENPEEIPLFPLALQPFVRGINGGVWYKPKPEVDENGDVAEVQPIRLIEDDLFAIKRLKSPIQNEGECLVLRHIPPKDPVAEFLFPVKFAYSIDKLKETLAHHGVTFPAGLAKHIADYLIKWEEYLKKQKAADIMRMQMGWTPTFDAFVAGNVEIQNDGTEKTAGISPLIRVISSYIKPTGDYAEWQRCANAFNLPGLELHALGLLAGFGSPLMSRTSTPGCTISYLSPESGVGKTGAMYAGLSVFGHPYYTSLAEDSTTANALTGRYLAMRNMMFGLDEASNVDNRVLSGILHKISSGRAKARMQASTNAEREIEMGASLIAVMTTNQSLYDKLKQEKKSPDGEIARTIEFDMVMPKVFEEDENLSKSIVDPFNRNYGHAGPIYIKHCFARGEQYIKELIHKWTERFREVYGKNAAYRFYENTIGCCFAGGELAIEAGIVDLDLERIFKAVTQEMVRIRRTKFKINDIDYKQLVGDFYNKNHTGYLILNDGHLVSEPRSEIVGRVEVHTGLQYISATAMNKYLASPGMQISVSAAEKQWAKLGILVEHPNGKYTKKQRLSTGWKQGTHTPPVACYVFKTDLPEDFFDDSRSEKTD